MPKPRGCGPPSHGPVQSWERPRQRRLGPGPRPGSLAVLVAGSAAAAGRRRPDPRNTFLRPSQTTLRAGRWRACRLSVPVTAAPGRGPLKSMRWVPPARPPSLSPAPRAVVRGLHGPAGEPVAARRPNAGTHGGRASGEDFHGRAQLSARRDAMAGWPQGDRGHAGSEGHISRNMQERSFFAWWDLSGCFQTRAFLLRTAWTLGVAGGSRMCGLWPQRGPGQ